MKTTFSRFFFPAALILLAALLAVGTAFQLLVKNYLTRESLEDLQADGEVIAHLSSAFFTDGVISPQDFYVNLSVATQVSGAEAVICDKSGKLVLCASNPMGCAHQGMIIDKAYLERIFSAGNARDVGIVEGLYEESRYIVGVPIYHTETGVPVGVVIVSAPLTQVHTILNKMADIYVLVSVLVVLASVLVMTFWVRRQSEPLRDMAKAASAFGHGQLDARVPVEESSPLEVQELALAFNNMASSLQKSEYQRQEFVANVSHELKTPMTTISGYVDGMLDGTIPPERQAYYMNLVSQETKRLSRLVRSMLDISRMQDTQSFSEEQLTQFDLCECAGQVLITFEKKIEEKQLQVEVNFPEHNAYTFANRDAITQVFYNLTDNAVKFCPEGGQLGLSIQEDGSKIYASVTNTGETIPAEELPLVFDRFHKLDKSRTQNRDGWGLGLYIVKTLICRHGEDISVTSQNGRTEFTFTLPLAN